MSFCRACDQQRKTGFGQFCREHATAEEWAQTEANASRMFGIDRTAGAAREVAAEQLGAWKREMCEVEKAMRGAFVSRDGTTRYVGAIPKPGASGEDIMRELDTWRKRANALADECGRLKTVLQQVERERDAAQADAYRARGRKW